MTAKEAVAAALQKQDVAAFADDLATVLEECGETLTVRALAEAFLDQNLPEEYDGDFNAAVKAAVQTMKFYA